MWGSGVMEVLLGTRNDIYTTSTFHKPHLLLKAVKMKYDVFIGHYSLSEKSLRGFCLQFNESFTCFNDLFNKTLNYIIILSGLEGFQF